MTRLDQIVRRNRAAGRRLRLRFLMMIGIGACIAAIAAMLLFTDLGQPAVPKRTHADGIWLRGK
jgi:hypothetical protein